MCCQTKGGQQKRAPRLLIGGGLVCLEPGGDGSHSALANTYVRVGVINERGQSLVKSSGAYGVFDTENAQEVVNDFTPLGLKRFGAPRYEASRKQAALDSRALLEELVKED
jgi:hypothetical protein